MDDRPSLRASRPVARWLIVIALALCGWWPTTVRAQEEAFIHKEKKPVRQWIAAVVFTGLVVGIAFKNPKRTHLG